MGLVMVLSVGTGLSMMSTVVQPAERRSRPMTPNERADLWWSVTRNRDWWHVQNGLAHRTEARAWSMVMALLHALLALLGLADDEPVIASDDTPRSLSSQLVDDLVSAPTAPPRSSVAPIAA
jgi:hypothetical protein